MDKLSKNHQQLVWVAQGYSVALLIFALLTLFPEFAPNWLEKIFGELSELAYGIAPFLPSLLIGFIFLDGIFLLLFIEWKIKTSGETASNTLRLLAITLFFVGAFLVYHIWFIDSALWCDPAFCDSI